MAFLNRIQQAICRGTDVLFVPMLRMVKKRGNGILIHAIKRQKNIKQEQNFNEAVVAHISMLEKMDI